MFLWDEFKGQKEKVTEEETKGGGKLGLLSIKVQKSEMVKKKRGAEGEDQNSPNFSHKRSAQGGISINV